MVQRKPEAAESVELGEKHKGTEDTDVSAALTIINEHCKQGTSFKNKAAQVTISFKNQADHAAEIVEQAGDSENENAQEHDSETKNGTDDSDYENWEDEHCKQGASIKKNAAQVKASFKNHAAEAAEIVDQARDSENENVEEEEGSETGNENAEKEDIDSETENGTDDSDNENWEDEHCKQDASSKNKAAHVKASLKNKAAEDYGCIHHPNLELNDLDELEAHNESCHRPLKQKCRLCCNVFRDKRQLSNHQLSNHGGKEFICINCDKKFKSELAFRGHN
ncbi:myoneurin-like [Tripterygium wilfordii]|uniref:myoneurin-like n=1 Tax=Tripterygium wilfordii TaxID=458696 RepID=UPI0018F81C92|nr:myoneurin-like [Tripterygium wilfordii]